MPFVCIIYLYDYVQNSRRLFEMADEMTPKKKRRFAFGRVNVLVTGLAAAFIALFLLIAKRPEISELEKRRLAAFPEFSVKTLFNGEFASGLHEWYVDTVPNRDGLQLIGADIRIDGYAYMAPGCPEKAAKNAYTDSYISHRNNGIYGAEYFAAVISDAFTSGDVKKSLYRGLEYIPQDCELASGLRWALDIWDKVGDYKNAAKLVDERYPGMHTVHTINNACLTVFGLALGGKDLGKVISNCVAMAHDCDCTAATAGSITGAAYGMSVIDEKWYKPFGDKVNSFFNGPKSYSINDLLSRYEKIADTAVTFEE